jgi:hypothetical protein
VGFLQRSEKKFELGHIAARVLCLVVANKQHTGDTGACMSIEMVLLIVIVTFAAAHLLNRLDTGRNRVRRSDSPRDGMWGGRD